MFDASEAADIATLARAYIDAARRARVMMSPRAMATVVIARGYLRLVARIEELNRELETATMENDLRDAGCATVIRCGEVFRFVGPDGRGVFMTVNAKIQEGQADGE